MNFNEYQLFVTGVMNPTTIENKDKRLENAVLGMTGEAGECADLLKKHKFHGHEFDREKFKKELGDTLFYVTEGASAIDCTLEELALTNVAKLSTRYPTGKFTTEDSIAKKDQVEYKVLPDEVRPLIFDPEHYPEDAEIKRQQDEYDDLCYVRELRERAENRQES